MESVSVVVAEHGADWIPWVQRLRRGSDSLILLVQQPTERVDEFAERVAQRVGRLEREAAPVDNAAYVAGDDDGCAERTRIVRRLSSLLSERSADTRLFLDDQNEHGPRGRNLMRALAWALSDLARGSRLSVAVGNANSAIAAV